MFESLMFTFAWAENTHAFLLLPMQWMISS